MSSPANRFTAECAQQTHSVPTHKIDTCTTAFCDTGNLAAAAHACFQHSRLYAPSPIIRHNGSASSITKLDASPLQDWHCLRADRALDVLIREQNHEPTIWLSTTSSAALARCQCAGKWFFSRPTAHPASIHHHQHCQDVRGVVTNAYLCHNLQGGRSLWLKSQFACSLLWGLS